jgi:hypothetical protein
MIQLMVENVLIVELYQHHYGVEMVQVIICAMLVVYFIKSMDQIDHYND